MAMQHHFRVRSAAALALLALPLGAPYAQSATPLSLAAALAEGDAHGFALRTAGARAAAADARTRVARSGVLPHLRLDAGAVRTTDPIGAFGALLRQRRVSAAAFNPATLNDPVGITTVQSAAVGELPLVNADAWAAHRAAQAAARAEASAATWTRAAYRLDVVRAYYGAVLAAAQVTVLEQATAAAGAGAREVDALVRQGLVTKADALQAGVRVAQVEAQLLAARHDALTAREALALLLGRTSGVLPVLPATLPALDAVRAAAAADTAAAPARSPRADLEAARAGLRAAEADADRARGAMLPRLNGFARYDWFTNDWLFAGKPAWTVGVMASWSVFGGGRESADRQAALAAQREAQAAADALQVRSAQELASTRRALALALEQLRLAERAAEQSREAFRLVDRRYGGGLATIAERLGAETSATAASLARSAAHQQLITALAAHRLAMGRDPGVAVAFDTEP